MDTTFDLLDEQQAALLYNTVIGQAGIAGWITYIGEIIAGWIIVSLLFVRFLSKNLGFRRKIHPVFGYAAGILLLSAASAVSWYLRTFWQMSVNAIMGYGIHFLVLLLFSVVFLKGRTEEKIFLALLCKTLEYIAEHVRNAVFVWYRNLSGSQPEIGMRFITHIILYLLVYLVFLFLLLAMIRRFYRKNTENLQKTELLILSGAFLMTWMLYFGMERFSGHEIFLVIAMIDILLFVFIRKMNTAAHLRQEQEISAIRLRQQEEEIAGMEQQYRELSILRHDIMHRMTCIRELIRQEETERAAAYIDKFIGGQESLPHIRSSSAVVNAVINTRFTQAQEYGIEASCRMTVQIPETLESDMSILLSNLLDNAIEASRKCQNAAITVTFTESGGYYRLIVKNTIPETVLKTNASLRTSKSDKHRHGWGLRSVSEIAQAHDGTVHFSEKDGMFIASVLLMKPENGNMGAASGNMGADLL